MTRKLIFNTPLFIVCLFLPLAEANITLVSGKARVGNTNQVELAISTFSGFIGCNKKEGKDLRLCTTRFMSPDTSGLRQSDYEHWLKLDYTVTLPYPCSAKEEQFARSVATDPEALTLCFDISIKRTDVGYVYFKIQADGQALLQEIKFSNAHLH